MAIKQYLEELKSVQENLLNFLYAEIDSETDYQTFQQLLNDPTFIQNQHKIKLLLRFLLKNSNNHYQGPNFFKKIERILLYLKDPIKKFYSNSEIFNIFKSNKRILLFLIKEQFIVIDLYIVKVITKPKYNELNYPQIFAPEILPFIDNKFIKIYKKFNRITRNNNWIENIKKRLPEDFELNRQNGENENIICQMIREDSVIEFLTYINRTNFSLNNEIKPSIYETHSFLINKKSSLIEYAAFFGSIQIFRYLFMNGVKLTSSLWNYVIHSNNPELIHFIEEKKVPLSNSYKELFIESIKCHHNDIANYFLNNFLEDKLLAEKDNQLIVKYLKYFNFSFIQNNYVNEETFYYLCRYDYYILVEILLNDNIKIINKIQYENKDEIFKIK